jgi:TolA-binding protein
LQLIDITVKTKKTKIARHHKESQVAKDKRVVMKNDLVNKGYLKRQIDTLQDEARSMRFKIFECQEANKKKQEQFFLTELETIENEIDKCKMELDK